MNLPDLDELIRERYVSARRHPHAPLTIYNYTPRAQYDRVWNETTLSCRGLILGDNGEVVARPFRKFFNLHEHDPSDIPDEPFDVFEKMDGSLGIVYWLDGWPHVATRGSFDSPQAQVGTHMLTQVVHTAALRPGVTYLLEIIYPENRIVVDYGDRRALTLLAVINNETGRDEPMEDIGLPVVPRYDLDDLGLLKAKERPNHEGYVVRFRSGFRVKVKHEEYVRLHRLMSHASSKTIWEALSSGGGIGAMLEAVPDEFYAWVRRVAEGLEAQYRDIETECLQDFRILGDRKSTALYFKTCAYPAVLFKMLDGKPYDDTIWKLIKPEYERPYMEVAA